MSCASWRTLRRQYLLDVDGSVMLEAALEFPGNLLALKLGCHHHVPSTNQPINQW